MAGRLPQHVIDEIRDRADIVDIVSNYVPLKKAGNSYKALCPFHSEKTPSFNVSPVKQICHCFGCGKGGNVFTFVMEIEKVSFLEAIQIVADRIGYEIPREAVAAADDGAPKKRRMYDVNAYAAELYNKALLSPQGEGTREYLKKRGITDKSIERFLIGFAPDGWDWLISQSTRSDAMEMLKAVGLALPRKEGQGFYDRFRNRLMFPIWDSQGRIIGFGGRTLDESDPKYLNSPDSPLFSKTNSLYGLNFAKTEASKKGAMMVMEGYTDVIAAHQAGFANAVATLGTALTEQHIRILKRFVATVVMVFDSDDAGRKASQRGIDLALRGEMNVLVAEMPGGMDPCEYITAHGGAAFGEAIDQAKDLFDYKIGMARRREDFGTVEGQAAAIDDVLTSVVNFTHRNRPKQELLLKKLSREFEVSEAAVRERLGAIQSRGPSREARRDETPVRRRNGSKAFGEWVLELMTFSSAHAELLAERGIVELLDRQTRPIAEALLAVLGDTNGETVEPARVFSRLETAEQNQIFSRVVSEAPEGMDCEKIYNDILSYVHKHSINKEINRHAQELAATDGRTSQQEIDYLRKIAALKRQSQPNSPDARS